MGPGEAGQRTPTLGALRKDPLPTLARQGSYATPWLRRSILRAECGPGRLPQRSHRTEMHGQVSGHCDRAGLATSIKEVDTMGAHAEPTNSVSDVADGDRGLDPGGQGERR